MGQLKRVQDGYITRWVGERPVDKPDAPHDRYRWRKHDDVLIRRQKIVQMRSEGVSIRDMADRLRTTIKTIERDLLAIKEADHQGRFPTLRVIPRESIPRLRRGA